MTIETEMENAIRRTLERERQRCADLAESLALVWERSAAKVRAQGTYTTGWWCRTTRVRPLYEKAARDIEAAAQGVRNGIMDPIRLGWTPLSHDQRDAMQDEITAIVHKYAERER